MLYTNIYLVFVDLCIIMRKLRVVIIILLLTKRQENQKIIEIIGNKLILLDDNHLVEHFKLKNKQELIKSRII